MILPVHDRVRAHVTRLLAQLYALDPADAPPVVLDYPPNRELGDLGHAGRLRAGAGGCARRRAPSRRKSPARSARSTA